MPCTPTSPSTNGSASIALSMLSLWLVLPRERRCAALHRLHSIACAPSTRPICEQRGLAEKTIYASLSFYDRFIAFRFGSELGPLDDIIPGDIVAFLREVMGRRTPYRDTTPPTHLRSLFRFLFWSK